MTGGADKRHGWAAERVEAFSFIIAIAFCAAICGYLARGMRADGSGDILELESRVNPNTAPVASLARLPGIGIVRAKAIEAYRQSEVKDAEGGRVFRSVADLEKIRGIGPKTAENMSQWLKFE